MATTLTVAVVRQSLKKNGTYPIRIRVYHNGKSCYLTTNISVRPEQLTKKLKIRDYNAKASIDRLMHSMQERINSIPINELSSMTARDIARVAVAGSEKFALDFPSFGYNLVSGKTDNSRRAYNSAIHSLCNYVGAEQFDISLITSSLLHGYENHLRSKYGDDARCVSMYINCISYIHKKAQEQYNNEEMGDIKIRNPFSYYKCPTQVLKKRGSVQVEIIQKLIDIRELLSGKERLGVDAFLASFALMGANVADLYDLKKPTDGIITYNRRKTHKKRRDRAEMQIRVEPVLDGFLWSLRGTDEHLLYFNERYACFANVTNNANIGLRKVCERYGLPKITVGNARHAWGSIAYSMGIDKNTINIGLCHVDKDMKVTDIYVERDWTILWDAHKKVMARFNWHNNL